jgi:hypothetical protein
MNTKLVALSALTSTAALCGYNTMGFAPYDKEKGFGFDAHFEGNQAFNRQLNLTSSWSIIDNPRFFSFALNGYYKWESGIFTQFGLEVGLLDFCGRFASTVPYPNLQIGKYVDGIGAIRVGLFNGFPGIGADYWIMYDRFKWLTTVEVLGTKSHGDFSFGARWLNRFFVTDHAYILAGVDHFQKRSQGFIGLGLAF